MTTPNIYLIGTGPMAVEYAKVLETLNTQYTVIGRGEESSASFSSKTGHIAITGGFDNYLTKNTLPNKSYVIIATGTEALMPMLLLAINAGAQRILIEKPAAISIEELLSHENILKEHSDKVFVAYNRRFYASIFEAQKLIHEDGGLKSMHFEFTEWAHKIEPLSKAPGVKENWFFANSTHVIDLAFFLAGEPVDWHCYSQNGNLSWHKKTNFSGAGVTEQGVLFSYISNWESAGRWSIELLTGKRRIYLKPLETIEIQQKGSIEIIKHHFDNHIDMEFKPGLYEEISAFFNDTNNLVTIEEHLRKSKEIFLKING